MFTIRSAGVDRAGNTGDRYDAVLVVSFGGPEKPADIEPFLANVTAGRGVPPDRLAAVAAQYRHVGGASPINEQCRRLRAALAERLAAAGHDLPVYWGNRNWTPYLSDTVAEMAAAGHRRVLAVVTSAYSSYSGCRQYLEDISAARASADRASADRASAASASADRASAASASADRASAASASADRASAGRASAGRASAGRASAGDQAPVIHKVRAYYDHPGFVEPFADAVRTARRSLPGHLMGGARLVFTAHSIPVSMAAGCAYVAQMQQTAALVAVRAGFDDWSLAWQSRSGPPSVPWLEPDVNDHLAWLSEESSGGVGAVVLAPIGFVTDHMEVMWDLDVVAATTAADLGIRLVRAVTPGTGPDERFVAMWHELIEERISPGGPRRALGELGLGPDFCRPECCPAAAVSGP